MLVGTVSSSGLAAVQRGLNRVDQAAEQIAKTAVSGGAETRPTDLMRPIVELYRADLQTQAAVKLLRVEEKMTRRLLDVTA
jgi:hypothetical protein